MCNCVAPYMPSPLYFCNILRIYRRFKSIGCGGSGSLCDIPSLFSVLHPPPPPSITDGDGGEGGVSSRKSTPRSPPHPSLLPSSGVRKRHDPKQQLIAKAKQRSLAEFKKLREGITSGAGEGVMSPRAAAKLLKLKMMRSRLGFGVWGLVMLASMCIV